MDSPLVHVANVLYLLSYSVRDILWLRSITIAAMLSLCYCYYQCVSMGKSDMYVPLWWQIAFIAINVLQIGLLIRERRPIKLTAMEQAMKAKALRPLTDRQIRRLISSGTLTKADRGDEIIREDTENANLVMITSGYADVFDSGVKIAELKAGQFAGEMSFLTGCTTTASVEARSGTEYIIWDEEALCDLSERDKGLGMALQSALGGDLVHKLLDTRSRQNHGESFDARGSITLPRDRIGANRSDSQRNTTQALRDSIIV